MTDIEATAYLVVKAERYPYGKVNPATGLRDVTAAKITASRQGRPATMGRDEILMKVTVRLPAEAFDPITPQALIVMSEDMVLARHEIEVEAQPEADE